MTPKMFKYRISSFKHNQRVRASIRSHRGNVIEIRTIEGMIRLDEGTPNILSIKDGDKHITRVPCRSIEKHSGGLMTPTQNYIFSLVGIIAGSLAAGFAICWPIARTIGYRDGAVDGYTACLDEHFEDDGEYDSVLGAEEIS